MAYLEWLKEGKYFEFADEYLMREKKAPSAAKMREYCGQQGSLETHQRLLNKWKETQHAEPADLPSKAEAIIVKRVRDLVSEGWNALEEANRDENLKIQQEASEAVQIAQDILNEVTKEKEAIARRLDELNLRFEVANSQNQLLLEKINEAEKLRFAADESRRVLNDSLNDLKERSKREKEELEKLYLLQVDDLRRQMTANESKYQQEINRRENLWENEKKDHENKLATQEILKEELNVKLTQTISEVNFYQTKYEQSVKDLEMRGETIIDLKNENQKLSQLLDENKALRMKQIGQIEQLEKQLNETREKNASLEYALKLKNSQVRELEETINQLSIVQSHVLSQEAI